MTALDEIREHEEQLLSDEVRGSEAHLVDLLSPDFVEFGASGKIWDRSQIVQHLQEAPPAARELLSFQARALAPNVVLATYRVRQTGKGHFHAMSLRSSIWVLGGERWQMVFHQGTPQPGLMPMYTMGAKAD